MIYIEYFLLGPSFWSNMEPTCGGSSQSPISLDQSTSVLTQFTPIQFNNYDVLPNSITLTNNGYTVKLDIDTNNPLTISNAGLPGTFQFAQLHFHWGATSDIGSEHTVNGRK